jgi:hypothetical protein
MLIRTWPRFQNALIGTISFLCRLVNRHHQEGGGRTQHPLRVKLGLRPVPVNNDDEAANPLSEKKSTRRPLSEHY